MINPVELNITSNVIKPEMKQKQGFKFSFPKFNLPKFNKCLDKDVFEPQKKKDTNKPASLFERLPYFAFKNYRKDSQKEECIADNDLCHIAANLSDDVYKGEGKEIEGWFPLMAEDNKLTGFKANAYKKDNTIIVAYCGTNDAADYISDTQMASGQVPQQFKEANEFYLKTTEMNPDCNVYVTGHSLGGSLAELVASKNDETLAITFNAFGTDKIRFSKEGKKLNLEDNLNAYNYIVEGDIISNTSKHVGTTTLLTMQDGADTNHSRLNFVSRWENPIKNPIC